jgi:dihydrofolate synthase/folylpolyglutamate synthase
MTDGSSGTNKAALSAAELARVEKTLAGRFPHHLVPDLARITELMDLLGQPQRSYPSIHLTGTNGKTTTARMVDSLLRAFGLRPGRYTSPHLESVTERISIAGIPLTGTEFAQAYDDIAPYVELVDRSSLAAGGERVTFFELLTAMAFAAFADAPVDVGVIEVGLGGTWDATNVLDASVCVVTPVSLDHTELLGTTVGQIATEKAGIVHEGSTLVLAEQPLEAAEVLLGRAAEVGAAVAREGIEFGVLARRVAVGGQLVTLQGIGDSYEEIFLPLHGAHMAHNAACALMAVEAFLGGGGQRLDIDVVREGFAAADSPGRLETVRSSPTILLDGAHNAAGAEALVATLQEAFAFEQLIGVVAIFADKDVAGLLARLEPALTSIVVTENSSPRCLPVDELAALAVELFGADRVTVTPRLDDALDAAAELADEAGSGGGVLVTGSFVTVGEARHLLRR